MTEREWLASEDPQAMLHHLFCWPTGHESGGKKYHPHRPSDRKMRLFAVECCVLAKLQRKAAEMLSDGYAGDWDRSIRWAHSWAIDDRLKNSDRANLLREIVGNPWRPVAFLRPGDKLKMLPEPSCRLVPAQEGDRVAATVLSIDGDVMRVQPAYSDLLTPATPGVWPAWRPPWLTPTVLSIATAAYEERPGRPCTRCTDGVGREEYGARRDCPDCHCSGIVEDGSLDPVRLAVLADALEDEGCTNEAILRHLRGPGPHVRGCAVLDLLLGKE